MAVHSVHFPRTPSNGNCSENVMYIYPTMTEFKVTLTKDSSSSVAEWRCLLRGSWADSWIFKDYLFEIVFYDYKTNASFFLHLFCACFPFFRIRSFVSCYRKYPWERERERERVSSTFLGFIYKWLGLWGL